MGRKRILVTGAGGSAGHNFIRSLRLVDEEFYIVGTDMNKYHIKLSIADKNYVVPHYTDPKYLTSIKEIIIEENIDFLHCQPDTELQVISQARETLAVKTMLPSKQAISLAFNKLKFNLKMKEFGVPVPQSFLLSGWQDVKIATRLLRIRGHHKFWIRAIEGAGSRGALPVTDCGEAEMWINYWNDNKDIKWGEFMISEFLPGKEYAFQSIWKDGELITSQARERLEYLFGNRMPSGQSSSPTIAKTVHNDKVNETAVAGIKVLDKTPNGIYCVDLKENAQDIPCITEINAGRFFTTSIFFSTAGVNMPYLYVKSAFNEPLPLVQKFNPLPKDLFWIRGMDLGDILYEPNPD